MRETVPSFISVFINRSRHALHWFLSIQTKYKFLIILLLAIFLRLLYIQNVAFDEIQYITASMDLLHDAYNPLEMYHSPNLRYALVGIVAFFVTLFGPTHLGVILIPVLCSMGTLILLYFIVKRLYGEKHALLASFLFAIFPLNIKYSTILEADVIIGFFMMLCFFLHVYHKRRWSYFVIGIILGVSLFIKFFIMLFFILLAIELFRTKQLKAMPFLLLGIFLGSFPFIMFQYVETGNPLYHVAQDKILADEYMSNHPEEPISFLEYILNPFSQVPEPSLFNLYVFFILVFFCLEVGQSSSSFFISWTTAGPCVPF